MTTLELRHRLEQSKDFNDVFSLVKAAVEKTIRLHRAGLTLVLSPLPNHIGAYHVMGSNLIVMNRNILAMVQATSSSKAEENAFVFSILTHEYLHALGFADEGTVRNMVKKISIENLGEDHLVVQMSSGDFLKLYPQLRTLAPDKDSNGYEIVKDFDSSRMPYIG
jgi:hypothetical protein